MTKNEVKAARATLNMTRVEFARAVGVTVHAVQSWELGRREPAATAVKLIGRLVAERARKRGK